jgi:hypothetical protein
MRVAGVSTAALLCVVVSLCSCWWIGLAEYSSAPVNLCKGNISTTEYNVLEEIYKNSNGPYWNLTFCGIPPYVGAVHGNPWVFPSSPSAPCRDNWVGVNCSSYNAGAFDDILATNHPECAIVALNLSSCNITGIMPSSIEDLNELRILDLRMNSLYGVLPSEIASLGNMLYIDTSYNALTSTIPPELGALTGLEYLNLYTNDFTGSVPPSLSNLTRLQYLGLGDSYATGSIPNSYTDLTNLLYLSISYSLITGTIPSNIHRLSKLDYFIIAENLCTGAVPDISDMTSVVALLINTNALTVLPTEFPKNLEIVIFYNNFFFGTLPESIYQPRLNELLIYGNKMTGPLPSTFDTATNLASMNVMKNKFTGQIPSGLGRLTSLVFCVFSTNYFSGPLPTNLTSLVKLQVFQVVNTFVTGPVPPSFGDVPNLFELYLTTSYLSSTIPPELGNCRVLNTLALAQNYLTGTVPADAIRNISTLQALNFTRNRLHGPMDALFTTADTSAGMLKSLVSLDLSFNSFTGTLSEALFNTLPALETVSLLINCLHGTITDQICEAQSLQVLVLDSINGGDDCNVYIPTVLRPVIHGSFSNGYIYGSIPPCLFQMGNLTTLHLSGNGLAGSIVDLPEDSHLIDLAINSNFLTGTIPSTIQRYGKFIQLGLSNNKFTGVLSNNFSVNPDATLLDLTVNRLSGPVPDTFVHVTNIDVLSGNVFGCNQAPENDPDANNYQCGSLALNVSMIVWLSASVLVMLPLLALLCLYQRRKRLSSSGGSGTPSVNTMSIVDIAENPMAPPRAVSDTRSISTAVPSKSVTNSTDKSPDKSPVSPVAEGASTSVDSTSSSNSNGIVSSGDTVTAVVEQTRTWWNTQLVTKRSFATSMLLFILKAAAHVAWVLALLYLVVLLTAYCAMKLVGKHNVSTHTYQYAWLSTAAYMHGLGPTLLIVLVLIIGALVITVFFFQVLSKLIQISEYFAAKTRILVLESERARPNTVINGTQPVADFGINPAPSLDREIEIRTYKSSVTTMVSASSLHLHPQSHSQVEELGANETTTPIDRTDRDTMEPIYRSRSSIFRLFGSTPAAQASSTNLHSVSNSNNNNNMNTRESARRATNGSNAKNVTSQLSSHWVSGYTTGGKHLFFREVCLHVMNSAVTIAANAGYVALLLNSSTSLALLSFVQIVLGMFKVGWKSIVVPSLVSNLLDGLNRSDQIFHQVFIDVFNFIASPVIATLLTDSSCFLNVFQAMMPVTTEFQVNANFYEVCPTVVGDNSSSTSVSAQCHSSFSMSSVKESVVPPWVYSYQCSSSIFVNYVPVLFYTFTLSGILIPMLQYLLMFARDDTILFRWSSVSKKYRAAMITNRIHWPTFTQSNDEIAASRPSTRSRSGSGAPNIPMIFNVGSLISTIILHLSVLMTFGMASPVLGLCVCLGLTMLAMEWRLVIGRYLLTCRLSQRELFKRIEEATSGICSGLFGCLRILVMMVSVFWGVISFDMIGDIYGIKYGIISTVCILAVAPFPFCVVFYAPRLVSRFSLKADWNLITPTSWALRTSDPRNTVAYSNGVANGMANGVENGSYAATAGAGSMTSVGGKEPLSSLHSTNDSNIDSIVSTAGTSNANNSSSRRSAHLTSEQLDRMEDPTTFLRDSFFLPRWTDDF